MRDATTPPARYILPFQWRDAMRRMAGLLCFTAVALCQQRATVAVDNDDTGGVVTGPKGPDAGVWVIAETSPYARARRAHRLLHAMVGLARFCNGFRRGALRPQERAAHVLHGS